MKIYLLTHERELDRKSNTGQLALEPANSVVERVVWERVKPNQQLLKLIDTEQALLIYTKGDGQNAAIEDFENIIIIDSTWQEALKIFNKSPYLKKMPRALLETPQNSQYKLRRNQPVGGLCTIECIIEILKAKGKDALAGQLALEFEQFNIR
jgi:DTW domain-containing protein YfiP